MADNRLDTRILLRYDKFSRLMNSDLILNPGEAAVAAFPNTDQNQPPRAFGLKVGDGQRYFDELPWIQAIAMDVYEWAKDPQKPVYQATEIQGLAEYIQAHGGGSGGGGSAGSGSYRIIWDAASNKYLLQQWDESLQEWVGTTSEIDLNDIITRIATIERWANGALTKLGNIEVPLVTYVYDEVVTQLGKINYNDEVIDGQFVTGVRQSAGKISVTRRALKASDISQGVLSTEHGGTGLNEVFEDQVLTGSINGTITTKPLVSLIEENRTSIPTTGAVMSYVANATAGLTGAMHFVGETSVTIEQVNSRADPQISGYNFAQARPGDVILANNAQEFVWTGTSWRLLGDEGSYAVKGSIVDADISDDAAIAQSKIDGLEDTLEDKVDKIEGKGLSTNDYTTEEKEKLEGIEDGAEVNIIEHILVNDTEVQPNNERTINLQIPILTEEQITAINNAQPNVIEHILVNGTEVPPTTINDQAKSVNIEFIPFTQQEKDKLGDIETGAEVNRVETISFNGGTPIEADSNKNIDITIDSSALHLNVLEGARYPTGNGYTQIGKDPTNKLLELSKVAATGNINDLVQTSNSYVILFCGSSTQVI